MRTKVNSMESKMRKLILVFMFLIMAYISFLIVESGIIPGVSTEIDEEKESLFLQVKMEKEGKAIGKEIQNGADDKIKEAP